MLYGIRNNAPNTTGDAVNQNNCPRLRLNPAALSFTGNADHVNHTANASARDTVLIASVRHARPALSNDSRTTGRVAARNGCGKYRSNATPLKNNATEA